MNKKKNYSILRVMFIFHFICSTIRFAIYNFSFCPSVAEYARFLLFFQEYFVLFMTVCFFFFFFLFIFIMKDDKCFLIYFYFYMNASVFYLFFFVLIFMFKYEIHMHTHTHCTEDCLKNLYFFYHKNCQRL